MHCYLLLVGNLLHCHCLDHGLCCKYDLEHNKFTVYSQRFRIAPLCISNSRLIIVMMLENTSLLKDTKFVPIVGQLWPLLQHSLYLVEWLVGLYCGYVTIIKLQYLNIFMTLLKINVSCNL